MSWPVVIGTSPRNTLRSFIALSRLYLRCFNYFKFLLSFALMENLDYNFGIWQHRHRHDRHHSRSQSFSCAWLDAICKSTRDDSGSMADKKSRRRLETRNVEVKNHKVVRTSGSGRRWEENPWPNNKKSVRGRSDKVVAFDAEKYEAEAAYGKRRDFRMSLRSNVSSTISCSSDCYTSNTLSITCPYLSSDSESLYRHISSIPTTKTQRNSHHESPEDRQCKWTVVGEYCRELHGKSSVRDENFRSMEKPFFAADHHAQIKSKSKSCKQSNKPKQQNSPGRKLASFLNSLFKAGSTKTKISSSYSVSESDSYDSSERKSTSLYSSFSSVQSRSCLSKSSKGWNNSSDSQKSLILYPTSIILNDDSIPSGEKCLHRIGNLVPKPDPPNYPDTHPSRDAYKFPALIKEMEFRVLEEDSNAAAKAVKEIIGKYQKDHSIMKAVVRALEKQDEEEDEDNDDASCSSSELFEVENLAGIDMNNGYQKELPVYGTTHLEINKAIAKGLLV